MIPILHLAQVKRLWSKIRPLATGGIALGILVAAALWGGAARIDALFLAGVGVLSAMILGFGALVWWLFLSPIPVTTVAQVGSRKASTRQLVGYLAAVSGLMFIVGGAWDETWHRLYGVGTVMEDFLWAPHKLLYGSMALTALFAGGGLLFVLRGRGDIRLRFRSEPLIGMLALASAYLVLSTPSDALWHKIYGLDITGWSLPHIFITTGSALVMITTATLLLSPVRLNTWRIFGSLKFQELLAGIMISAGVMILTQAAATEWEGLQWIGDPHYPATFWNRPEWLYPVVILSISIFFSAFAITLTRRAGFATYVFVLALVLRVAMLSLMGIWGSPGGITFNAHILMILPALGLDVWYALRLKQADETTTLVGGDLIAAFFFLITGLPVISALMIYPRINASTAPAMIAGCLVMSQWFGWVGARFGGWMGSLAPQNESSDAISPQILWVGIGALAVFAALTIFYILTAVPPAV